MPEVTALGSVGPGIPFLSHGPVAGSAVSLSLQEARQVKKSQKWLLSGPVWSVLLPGLEGHQALLSARPPRPVLCKP